MKWDIYNRIDEQALQKQYIAIHLHVPGEAKAQGRVRDHRVKDKPGLNQKVRDVHHLQSFFRRARLLPPRPCFLSRMRN